MDKITTPSAGKINWNSHPKALVIRYAHYCCNDVHKDEYITIKIVFKRGVTRRVPIESKYDDKCFKMKSVESYEILKDESSKRHSVYFHVISGKHTNLVGHPSELFIFSPKGYMYYQVIRQVEE